MNIWATRYSDSTYASYIATIIENLKLSSYYSYSTECLETYLPKTLDDLYYMNVNFTANTGWEQFMFNVSDFLADDINFLILNCYRFTVSAETVNVQKWNAFDGFEDIYTSFLFNMLAQSVSIKTYAENMITYNNAQNWVSFSGEVAKVVRVLTEFESASAGSFGALRDLKLRQRNDPNGLMNDAYTSELVRTAGKSLGAIHEFIAGSFPTLKGHAAAASNHKAEILPNGVWEWTDYLDATLGFVDGVMGALPSDSSAFYCSTNSSSSRTELKSMIT